MFNSKILKLYLIVRKTLSLAQILFFEYGLLRSLVTQKPEINNRAIPWFTIPAIEYLNSLNLKSKTLFEWGSGNSTLFWADKVKKVIAVEDDNEWMTYVLDKAPKNVSISLAQTKNKYINILKKQHEKFDIIVVDGHHRLACARQAITHLKATGFIILDNSDWHPLTSKMLREHNLLQIDFHGFYHGNGYTGTTSIFLQKSTKLEFQKLTQKPIGGITQNSFTE